MKSSVCMCFSTKGTEEPYKTVKLTLYDRATASLLERKTIGLKPKTKKSAKSAISRRPFAETNQTARISLQISSMSKSNPETKTRPVRPNLPARPPSSTPELSTFRSIQTSAQPPFQRPSTASAAPVKGYLESAPELRKQKSQENRKNRRISCNSLNKKGLFRAKPCCGYHRDHSTKRLKPILAHYPQPYPQMPLRKAVDSPRVSALSRPDRAFRQRLWLLPADLRSRKERPQCQTGVS